MAIYHLNVKTGSRDGGQSARARAQYIALEEKCETGRDELAHSESGHMPEWAADDLRQYWAAADAHERVNGRLFLEAEFALPKELNEAEQRTLAGSFAAELTGQERLLYTMALRRGGGENPHVHLMISERGRDGHDRDAERWFKRYNAKEPERVGRGDRAEQPRGSSGTGRTQEPGRTCGGGSPGSGAADTGVGLRNPCGAAARCVGEDSNAAGGGAQGRRAMDSRDSPNASGSAERMERESPAREIER